MTRKTSRRIPYALTILSAGLLAAGVAFAAGTEGGSGMGYGSSEGGTAMSPPSEEHPLSFSELDLNHDGQISQNELAQVEGAEKKLQGADTNNDGEISRSEFSAFEAKQQPEGGMQQPESAPPPPSGNGMEESQ